MMTDRADGEGGAASSVRMFSDNASDASDDDSRNVDTRKRKELSVAAPDAAGSSDQNKRTKHEFSEYSGASFDPQQSAGEAAELDTSFDSRGDISSGEECFDPFTQHKLGAFKQVQRDDCWSGERNLLQLQLGSFIQKEKLRLESESERLHSRSSTESAPDDRFSGSSSLSGYLRGSSSFAESSENTGYYSSRTSSVLSSVMRNNKKKEAVRVVGTEERASLTRIVQGVSWPSQQVHKSASVHQKFVLSSGRPSNVTAAREDTRAYTIDRDFDDYFAKLML